MQQILVSNVQLENGLTGCSKWKRASIIKENNNGVCQKTGREKCFFLIVAALQQMLHADVSAIVRPLLFMLLSSIFYTSID